MSLQAGLIETFFLGDRHKNAQIRQYQHIYPLMSLSGAGSVINDFEKGFSVYEF